MLNMYTLQQIWSKYHPPFWVFIRCTHMKLWSNHRSVRNLIPTPTSIRPIFMPERANARKALWAPGPAKQQSNTGCQRWHFARRQKNIVEVKFMNWRTPKTSHWHLTQGWHINGTYGSSSTNPKKSLRLCVVSRLQTPKTIRAGIHRFLSFKTLKCFMGNYHAWCSCLGATSGPQFDVQGINAQLLSTGHWPDNFSPVGALKAMHF